MVYLTEHGGLYLALLLAVHYFVRHTVWLESRIPDAGVGCCIWRWRNPVLIRGKTSLPETLEKGGEALWYVKAPITGEHGVRLDNEVALRRRPAPPASGRAGGGAFCWWSGCTKRLMAYHAAQSVSRRCTYNRRRRTEIINIKLQS